ncbi:MAG: hypothetical protein ABI168_11680, partial [Ginsengibacter sp.]
FAEIISLVTTWSIFSDEILVPSIFNISFCCPKIEQGINKKNINKFIFIFIFISFHFAGVGASLVAIYFFGYAKFMIYEPISNLAYLVWFHRPTGLSDEYI